MPSCRQRRLPRRDPADDEAEVRRDRASRPYIGRAAIHPPLVEAPVGKRDAEHEQEADGDRDRARHRSTSQLNVFMTFARLRGMVTRPRTAVTARGLPV